MSETQHKSTKPDEEHLGKILKEDLKSIPKEIAEEFWLPAVGIGVVAIIIGLVMLIAGASMKGAPERVSSNGYGDGMECSQVLKELDPSTMSGKVALAFSSDAKAAKEQCEQGALKTPLTVVGSLLLVIAAVWTAGFGRFGYLNDIKPDLVKRAKAAAKKD